MKQNNRGQAALEFLLTYSWAILVVIVIIGALAYFGVLNPTNFIPPKCTFQAGIGCQDFVYYDGGDGIVGNDNDQLVLQLTNGLGNAIQIRNVNIVSGDYQDATACTSTWDPAGLAVTPDGTDPNVYTFQNGATVEVEIDDAAAACALQPGLTSGNLQIEIVYRTAGGIDRDKSLNGDVFVKV